MTQKLGLMSIEKALLLHLLYAPDLIPEAASIIKQNFFSSEFYGLAFKTLEDLYSDGEAVTKPVFMNEIENKYKMYEEAGQKLIKRVYKPATPFEECMDRVKEEYQKRKMTNHLKNALKEIDRGNLEEATNIVNSSMEDYVGEERETVATGSDAMADVYEELMGLVQNGYKPTGIPILYPSLQAYIESYKPGNLIIIAAETGGGKSSLAINIAKQISVDQNYKTLYFSLEMKTKAVMLALMASVGKFNRGKASRGRETELGRIETAKNRLLASKDNLIIDDRAMADMRYIKKRIKQVKMKYGVDAVVIDHAGLISSDKDNIYAQSDYVYNELKKIAKDLNVCIFALAQFSRAKHQVKDSEPQLHHLKGGSSIEQACDIALLMDNKRDEYTTDIEDVDILVKKNRSGKIGRIRFKWDKSTNTFEDVDVVGARYGSVAPALIPIEDETEQQKIKEVFEEN